MADSNQKEVTNKLQTHKKVHKCDQCHRVYTRRGHMKRHQTIFHNGRRFMCPYCKLSFTRTSNMVQHISMNRRCKQADEVYFNRVMGLPFAVQPIAPSTQAEPTADTSTRDDYTPRVVGGHLVHPAHTSSSAACSTDTDAWPVPHHYMQPHTYRHTWAGPSILDLPEGGIVISLPEEREEPTSTLDLNFNLPN